MRLPYLFLCLLGACCLAAQRPTEQPLHCAQTKKFTGFSTSTPSDLRSDSVDIISTSLFIDMGTLSGNFPAARATLLIRGKKPDVKSARFDLLGFTIDSVSSTKSMTWSYNGQQLTLAYDSPLGMAIVSDTLRIHYHGSPAQDASGWGGFYWQSGYAYNLGVGFEADPHSFGRAWFPCFDNFQERCRFEFSIITPADKRAYCNGALTGQQTLPDGRIQWDWSMSESIPSYLACVAVGPYLSWERTFQGETGPVPVQIATLAADTNKLKNSFIHLKDALDCYEHWYGPHRFNKIGYSLVPFNSGAMEHATNIAYMRSAVDGTLNFESLMAHELSHHWWGDLVTCSTAEDMWLNEGWASYSEHLLVDWLQGPQAYLDAVETNFLSVLQNTHVEEGGYRAVSGLPHSLTYGSHVYDKGAVVAHNLRTYLGDSLFRAGIRAAMTQNAFRDWSSGLLEANLEFVTGYPLHDFFNDWVFQPGFADFSVDSFQLITPVIDTFTIARVFVKQKLRGAEHFYQNVPLEFTFLDASQNRQTIRAEVSGETDSVDFHFPLPFVPARIWLNTGRKLTLARAAKELTVQGPVTYNFNPAKMNIALQEPIAPTPIRVVHHFAMPDTGTIANPNHYQLTNRYWTVDGFFDQLPASASIVYDGKGQLDQLDAELFAQTTPSEDSVLLLFRQKPGQPWMEYPDYFKSTLGSANDRFGLLRINQLQRGQYTIGKGESGMVDAHEPGALAASLSLYPNPAGQTLTVKAGEDILHLAIFNAQGAAVLEQHYPSGALHTLRLDALPAGAYHLLVTGKAGISSHQFIKQ